MCVVGAYPDLEYVSVASWYLSKPKLPGDSPSRQALLMLLYAMLVFVSQHVVALLTGHSLHPSKAPTAPWSGCRTSVAQLRSAECCLKLCGPGNTVSLVWC